MAQDSTPFNDIFSLDKYQNLLICIRCCEAVNPQTVESHLRTHHATQIDRSRRAEVAKWAKSLTTWKSVAEMNIQGPIHRVSGIHVRVDGLRCEVDDCGYMAGKESTMENHIRDRHNITAALQDDLPCTRRIPFQQLFRAPPVYTEVEPLSQEDMIIAEENPAERFWDDLLDKHELEIAARRAERARLPIQFHQNDHSPWMAQVGWLTHLRGLDSRALSSASRLPDAKESELRLLRNAIEELCNDLHKGAQTEKCPAMIRRLLNSPSATPINIAALDFNVRAETFTRYTSFWIRFMLYLQRSVDNMDEHRLVISESQEHLIQKIALKTSKNNGRELKEIKALVFALSIDILQQKLTGWTFASPLIHFLSVLGIDAKNLVFHSPSTYTPYLAAILYVGRLFLLEGGSPSATREVDLSIPEFKEYHAKNIADESLTPLTEVSRQLAYGLVVAKDHGSRPICSWSSDKKTLYFGKNTIAMQSLREMVQGAILSIKGKIMIVLKRSDDYFATRDPSCFVDHLAWRSCGECFSDFEENNLGAGHRRVLDWWKQSEALENICKDTSFNVQAIGHLSFLGKEINRELAALTHFTSGQPARATEFVSMRIRNGWTLMRGVYIQDKELMTVIDYSKSQGTSGSPRAIPRFPPIIVSQLIISYIVDIQPWIKWLESLVDARQTLSDEYLWSKFEERMNPGELTTALQAMTKKHLGVDLGVAQWRQIAIAIDRDLIRGFVEDDFDSTEDENHALQAGHTESTERKHYGRRLDMLDGLDSSSIREFRNVSQQWHAFLGFNSAEEIPQLQSTLPQTQNTRLVGNTPPIMGPPRPRSPSNNSFITGFRTIIPSTPNIPPATIPMRPLSETFSSAKRTRVDEVDPFVDNGDTDIRAIVTAMRNMNPPRLSFKSDTQREAIKAVVDTTEDVCIIIPTGGGKSLVFQIAALIQKTKGHIVVVPFAELLRETIETCISQGISSLQWQRGTKGMAQLVFVSAELAICEEFKEYVRYYTENRLLSWIMIDEAHVPLINVNYRTRMEELPQVTKLAPRVIFMTATLPRYLEQSLNYTFGVEARSIRGPTMRPDIKYIVRPLEETTFINEAIRIIKSLEHQLQRDDARGMIFPVTKEKCDFLRQELKCWVHHNDLEDKKEHLALWKSGQGSRLIAATAGLGQGNNFPHVGLVVHLSGPQQWQMTEFIQESGRAARETTQEGLSLVLIERGRHTASQRMMSSRTATTTEVSAMANFIGTPNCRRLPISAFMDDLQTPRSCIELGAKRCDNCVKSSDDTGRPQSSGLDIPTTPTPTSRATSTPHRTEFTTLQSHQGSLITQSQINSTIMSPTGRTAGSREYLTDIFNKLKTLCGPCWLVKTEERSRHPWQSCKETNFGFSRLMNWKKGGSQFSWPRNKCAMGCGGPLFVCKQADWGNYKCQYQDILLPLLLAAFHNTHYHPIITRVDADAAMENEQQFRQWIVKHQNSRGTPTVVAGGSQVTNAIAAFDAVVRSRDAMSETHPVLNSS